MATEEDNQHNDVVAIDLPAPSGWSKKCTLKKVGSPQRNDIVFISPTGEEIKNKRQLDQYLKSHPGGPAASEFDWGSGDSPRRSTRLSAKSKAVVTPASWAANKKQKRSTKKGAQEKINADAEAEATGDKDAAAEEEEEAKETLETSTVDAKDAIDEDVIPEKPSSEDMEKKTDTQVAPEEPSAAAPVGTETEDMNVSVNATTVVADAKVDECKNDETKEATDTDKNDETDSGKNGETKEAIDSGKETADEKVEEGVAKSKEEEAEKKAPSL